MYACLYIICRESNFVGVRGVKTYRTSATSGCSQNVQGRSPFEPLSRNCESPC